MTKIDKHIQYTIEQVRSENAVRPTTEQRVQQLATAAAGQTQKAAPAYLLNGHLGEKRIRVTAGEMDLLSIGRRIADAVDGLFSRGSSNQRLSMASSPDNNPLHGFSLHQMPHENNIDKARNSIIIRTGNCAERANVAFQIARSLGIPAAVVSDNLYDHVYLLLADKVVVDPWPAFSTVCLSDEAVFKHTKVYARHNPGDPVPNFDLSEAEEIRDRIEQKLGPNAIRDALHETRRMELGIRSPLLDKHLRQQGHMRYDRIKTTGLPEDDKQKVAAEQKRIKKLVHEEVLRLAAESVRTKAKTIKVDPPRITRSQSITPDNRAEVKTATQQATEAATRAAKRVAKDAALRKVTREANAMAKKAGTTRVPKEIESVATGSATRTQGMTTVTVEAKAKAVVQPDIRDQRLTAPFHSTYVAPDGRTAQFNTTSEQHLKRVARENRIAKEKNFPDAYIRATKAGSGNSSAGVRRDDEEITDSRLKQATTAKVASLLDDLRASVRAAPQDEARLLKQRELLDEIEDRLEFLPNLDDTNTTMMALADDLPLMQGDILKDAIAMLERWEDSVHTDSYGALLEALATHMLQDSEPGVRRRGIDIIARQFASIPFADEDKFQDALRSAIGKLQAMRASEQLRLLDVMDNQLDRLSEEAFNEIANLMDPIYEQGGQEVRDQLVRMFFGDADQG